MVDSNPLSSLGDGGDDGTGRPVKTVERALDLLEYLCAAKEPVGVTTIAEDVDLSKSSVHNYLSTLERRGYVVRRGEKYRAGLRALVGGERARSTMGIYREARPHVDDLAAETGELVELSVEEHGLEVQAYKARGERGIRVAEYDAQMGHLHCTAAGKAILAHLPGERVDEVVERHGLPAKTDETVTTRPELNAELRRVRDAGVAYERDEAAVGFWSVAAPIFDLGERPRGALSVTMPTKRVTPEREEELTELLTATASDVDVMYRYRD